MPVATTFVITNSCDLSQESVPSSLPLGIQHQKFFNLQRSYSLPIAPPVHCPRCPPCPFSPCYVPWSQPRPHKRPECPSCLTCSCLSGNANPGRLHRSACSCPHPYNRASQVLHHCVDQCQFQFMTISVTVPQR